MTGTKPAWKNRMDSTIVEVPAEELLANPFNWRIHTQLQQHAVEGSLNEIGWVDAVKVNTTTQHVVDGHLRATLAYRRGGKTPVPVIYVTLTADEERIALAAIGITAEMGVHDDSKLLEIVQSVKANDNNLQALMDKIGAESQQALDNAAIYKKKNPKTLDDLPDDSKDYKELERKTFTSSHPLGFPELLPEHIPTSVPARIATWVGGAVVDVEPDLWYLVWGRDGIDGLDLNKTVVSFYTHDRFYQGLWFKAEIYARKIAQSDIMAVLTPPYYIGNQDPAAQRHWQRYRSLWVGRYLQEAGIKVIPNVQIVPSDKELCWAGVPKNVPIAIQFQVTPDSNLILDMVQAMVDELDPNQLLIYTAPAAIPTLTGHGFMSRAVIIKDHLSTEREIHDKEHPVIPPEPR